MRKYEQILIEDVDDPVAQWWKLHWNQDNTLLVEVCYGYMACCEETLLMMNRNQPMRQQ